MTGIVYIVHIIYGCLISEKDAKEILRNYLIAPNNDSYDEEEERMRNTKSRYIDDSENDEKIDVKIYKSEKEEIINEDKRTDEKETSDEDKKCDEESEDRDEDCSIERKILNPPQSNKTQYIPSKNIYLFSAAHFGEIMSWCIYYDRQDYDLYGEVEMIEMKPVDANEMNYFKIIAPLFDVAGNRIRLIKEVCENQLNGIVGLVNIIIEYYMSNANQRKPLRAGQYLISSIG